MVLRKPAVVEGDIVRIYIEGDGAAYTPSGQPSGNPTPRSPVALHLMQADTSGAELYYIGRPCQWVKLPQPGCTPARWSSERFTPDILAGYTQFIGELTQWRPTELVGFSGGAWLAYGVGQALPNVLNVRSVAGNLNPNAIHRHHGVPPIKVAETQNLRRLPLVLFEGGADKVIPPKLSANIADGLPCVVRVSVPAATHTSGWRERWVDFLRHPLPKCTENTESP